jgi:hypothetical protein
MEIRPKIVQNYVTSFIDELEFESLPNNQRNLHIHMSPTDWNRRLTSN